METKELICIGCPLGCMMNVAIEKGQVIKISGNSCQKGEQYAKKEVINPTRIITSTVIVKNGELPMVSVKTSEDIPKDKIKDCMKELKGIIVEAPICIGDIIVRNVLGTNVNVIATKNVRGQN
ncbi:MAG: hypothetical protein K0R15_1423 [Clostridiales bacterium]|jgi:CxxC motif-containing protein|nr:hypothetical protein [Clostridiales bacterium]